MRKLLPLLGGLATVAILAWACSDDEVAPGGRDGGLPDAPVAQDTSVPTEDSAADECVGVNLSVPTGAFGNPNENAPADAGRLYTNVPFPAENPYSYEKAILGKILFWEEQVSSDNTVACGTCHHPAAGGSDPRAVTSRFPRANSGTVGNAEDPHGASGIARCDDSNGTVVRKSDGIFGMNVQVTRRKPPTYLDAMFSPVLFWDGRARNTFVDPEKAGTTVIQTGGALESQAVMPPLNDTEMACEGRSWAKLEAKLASAKPLARAKKIPKEMVSAVCKSKTYPELFRVAFGTPDITAARIAMAIATHERTLISNQTPYDRDLAGDTNALTPSQKLGRDVYFGKALCVRCHQAPTFSFTSAGGNLFANLGFDTDAGIAFDRGRMDETDAGTDIGLFRTVTLRNVGLREAAGLLHNGVGAGVDLPTLIAAYNQPPQRNYNTSPLMKSGLTLVDAEIAALVDFLRNGLTDSRAREERLPFDRPQLGSE